MVLRKRRYNANRFADLWENRDGTAIYASLIPNARRIFIRYLDIPLENYRDLINGAAKFAVNSNRHMHMAAGRLPTCIMMGAAQPRPSPGVSWCR